MSNRNLAARLSGEIRGQPGAALVASFPSNCPKTLKALYHNDIAAPAI
jgi:hypothetical protein